MIIYLDFDGTVVEHQYPILGRYNDGCFEVIQKLQQAGHEIILNTYRVNCDDGTLEIALDFLNNNPEYTIEKITKYTPTKVNPGRWNSDIFKEEDYLFIDDICKGTPLKKTVNIRGGKMVDWQAIDALFARNGLYESGKPAKK